MAGFDDRQRQLKASLEQMTKDKNLASSQKKIQASQRKNRAAAELDLPEKPSVILRPSDIAGSYDATRMLYTTLGGKARKIHEDDLKAFAANIQTAQEKFAGGIKPQQVIDWSFDADRKRSTEQIRLATEFARKNNVVRYITNAGPESKKDRHYVDIEFVDYAQAVTGAKSWSLSKIRQEVANGRVRFDCDCEHHRYRFRYIATLGKYNHGEDERGFPKITNPNLIGLACKHVLRVMQKITSPQGAVYLKTCIDKDRSNTPDRDKSQRLTPAQVKQQLEQQQATAHHKRHAVQASHEKPSVIHRMRAQAIKEAQKLAAEQAKRGDVTRLYQESVKQLEAAHKAGLLTGDVYQNLIRGLAKP